MNKKGSIAGFVLISGLTLSIISTLVWAMYLKPQTTNVLGTNASCKPAGGACLRTSQCCKPNDNRLNAKCSWFNCSVCVKPGVGNLLPGDQSRCCSGKFRSCKGSPIVCV